LANDASRKSVVDGAKEFDAKVSAVESKLIGLRNTGRG
jgi:hypothetical protein